MLQKNIKVPFVDLKAQYAAIGAETSQAVMQVLQRADFILGHEVDQFEEEFADYCQVKHGVGVDSGTSAIELALRAFDIGPGDEVITVANTFIATALAISYTGATPVLVDAEPRTYMMDTSCLEEAITSRTRAIIPVHLFGHPADMDPIMDIARQHGLMVIEDACQAHGARYKGRRAGSIGHAAAFSFYPGKNLGAYGDGGMIVTNDDQIADKLHLLRNYGQREKYHHELKGFNRRLDTLQAAVLRAKLIHLDDWNEARREHAGCYQELLQDSSVITPLTADYAEPVWHLYPIRTRDRKALQDHLAKRGISTGIHYPIPIHLSGAYQDLGYRKGWFTVTEQDAEEILSLPMYAELSPEQIEYVADAINEFEQEQSSVSSETEKVRP